MKVGDDSCIDKCTLSLIYIAGYNCSFSLITLMSCSVDVKV